MAELKIKWKLRTFEIGDLRRHPRLDSYSSVLLPIIIPKRNNRCQARYDRQNPCDNGRTNLQYDWTVLSSATHKNRVQMDRRQFLSLSAVACLGAARRASAVKATDTHAVGDFDIAFITDVQIERGEVAVSKFSETISEINSCKPAFVWDMGDMSLYPSSGKVYLDCVRKLRMPLYACPGNHDIALYDTNPRMLFNDCFGRA